MRGFKCAAVAAVVMGVMAVTVPDSEALTAAEGTGAPAVDRTPACEQEDGPGRCVWDARHMGNGYGDSFVIRATGAYVYVSHRRAHRLMVTSW